MLLVIDVGNTNTVIGVMKDSVVQRRWRISSVARTTDEFGMLTIQLLENAKYGISDIVGACVSCVVPSVLYSIEKSIRRYFKMKPLIIGKGMKTGMRVRTDNPREVGSDRIVNAIAAYEQFNSPCVVVDFGTATTLDCVNEAGDYLGGAIAPGFAISAEALFQRAAKLPKVEVEKPAKVIGTNTISAMQSGLYWGYVGLVDELARRCKIELQSQLKVPDATVRCVATGGLANLIGRSCTEIESVDEHLTFRGLWILYQRNSAKK